MNEQLETLIEDTSYISTPDTPEGRTYRIGVIANNLEGNFIEIGAGTGHTTEQLLKAAKESGGKVLVIDPWQSDATQPPGYGVYAYDEFWERVKDYQRHLVVAKMPSYFKEVGKYLSVNGPYIFAFVDGLQLRENVLSDLFLMSAYNVKVICVDDINRSTPISQVPEAVEKFLAGNKLYKRVQTRENLIECYLIRLS